MYYFCDEENASRLSINARARVWKKDLCLVKYYDYILYLTGIYSYERRT